MGPAGITLEELMLGLGVERGRRLVENREQRLIAHEAAGEGQLLPLAEGDIDAIVPGRPELRAQAAGQGVDDVPGSGPVQRGEQGRIDIKPRHVAKADRLPGLKLEPEEVLERPGQPLAATALGRSAPSPMPSTRMRPELGA